LIDSGVLAGHPVLEPAIAEAVALHPEFGGQADDAAGHGTMVAGLSLYGNVLAAARAGRFEPDFWLASVRVLDENADFPESVNWIKAISEAITYLVESWQVRVINLSIGDSSSPFAGGKSTPLAAELDTLSVATASFS
jgi:subtilisin family serine protease